MKNLILFFVIGFCICNGDVFSQNTDWLWAKNVGGNLSEEGKCVTTDLDGNVYVVGSFNSSSIVFGNFTLINNGLSDAFFVKYDSLGNVLWAKSVGDNLNERAVSVTTDDMGNVYFVGDFDSQIIDFDGTQLTNSYVDPDMFLAKYSSSGVLQWVTTSTGAGSEYARSVQVSQVGEIYIGGYLNGPLNTFGNITLISSGDFDVFIAKYDSTGNALWAKAFGGTLSDQANFIAIDDSSNTYLTGNFSSPSISFDNLSLTNAGQFDVFVTKFDSLGNALWAKAIGGAALETTAGVSVDAAGNVYLAGSFYDSIMVVDTFHLSNAGGSDIFISKLDNNGIAIWAKTINGTSFESASALKCSLTGETFIGGRYYGSSFTIGTTTMSNITAGQSDIFIAKFDTNGNELWAKCGNDSGNSLLNSIALNEAGNVYSTGSYTGTNMNFGNYAIQNAGASDIFLAKMGNVITGLEDILNQDDFTLYPNPSSNTITFDLSNNSSVDITITDCSGKVVYSAFKNESQIWNVDISNLTSGLYFAKVISNEVVRTNKLLVVR